MSTVKITTIITMITQPDRERGSKHRAIYKTHKPAHMVDVIDDKLEGFIMYKHETVGRGFIHYHINHERV